MLHTHVLQNVPLILRLLRIVEEKFTLTVKGPSFPLPVVPLVFTIGSCHRLGLIAPAAALATAGKCLTSPAVLLIVIPLPFVLIAICTDVGTLVTITQRTAESAPTIAIGTSGE